MMDVALFLQGLSQAFFPVLPKSHCLPFSFLKDLFVEIKQLKKGKRKVRRVK